MIWYATLKDIRNFAKAEKTVFIWLIASMITVSFVLNYSYSFARYRGNLYDYNTGVTTPVYKISSSESIQISEFEKVVLDFDKSDFPEVVSVTCFTTSESGMRIAGTSDLSSKDAFLTGLWVEGYAKQIPTSDEMACVVDESLLSYGNRVKMTGETFKLEQQDFIIRGVFESFVGSADILIHMDKYKEIYGNFDSIWITFKEELNDNQKQQFETVMKQCIEHGSITYPEMDSSTGDMIAASNRMQYSIFIVLQIVFLAAIIQYWYDVNISTYTIYWITGASTRKLLGIVFDEVLILCLGTYVIGLVLNALARLMFTTTAPLTPVDVALGFGLFFGTMLIFSLKNMVQLCKTFSVTNIRRN